MKLQNFLDAKPLFYKKIDFDRMPNTYQAIKSHFTLPPIVHVIGTNGKGSTGRWLALMLLQAGFSVGHYTSPHILKFRERFWIDGDIVTNEALENAHKKLFMILGQEHAKKLSYFEYATFLAAILFEKLDFVIMEAGLGGEFDATNVFKKQLSIVTPIGFDHQDFLGDTLEKITTTKLNSLTTTTIISEQCESIILQKAKEIAKTKGVVLKDASKLSDATTQKKIDEYIKKYHYADFLKTNILTAYAGAQELGIKPNFNTLKPLDLKGRFEKIAPNITIDVGHNPLSAKHIATNFKKKSIILIYNSFKDKDIPNILKTLEPITTHVELLPIHDKVRENGEDIIKQTLDTLSLPWSYHQGTIQNDKNYLVFGSFYLVEAFLKSINEK